MQSNIECANGGGGALANLFALAHLAAISEEERGVVVSPTPDVTDTKESVQAGPFAAPLPATAIPNQRRPVKKRAIETDTEARGNSKKIVVPSPSSVDMSSKHQHPRKGSNAHKMKTSQPSFPLVLMAIMSSPQNNGFITFLSDGQSFVIINPDGLQKCVLHHHAEFVPTYDHLLHLLAKW